MKAIYKTSKKIKKDYILLILHCEKYKFNRIIQMDTYLKYLPEKINYYHIIGNSNLEKEYEFYENEKIIVVKSEDDYLYLPLKIMKAYQAIYDTYDFKYIFKTDDTQICIYKDFFDDLINRLIKFEENDNKSHYGGFIVNLEKQKLCEHYKNHPELPNNRLLLPTIYCSGSFYYLSSDAMNDLIVKKEQIIKDYLEDYSIGYNLSNQFKKNMIHIPIEVIFLRYKNDYLLNSFNKEIVGKIKDYF